MKTFINRIREKLVNKLIFLFTTIIILVVVSLTFISYKMLEQQSVKNMIASNSNNLKIVNNNFDKYFTETDELTFPQLQYDEVMTALVNEENDYSARLYLEHYLWRAYYSRSDIESIYLYLIDQQKVYYISRTDQDVKVRVSSNIVVPNLPWYKKALESDRNRYLESLLSPVPAGYPAPPKKSFMAYHRTLRTLMKREPKAIVSFYFTPKLRDEIAKEIPVSDKEHVILLNSEHVPFYIDDPAFFSGVQETDLFRRADGAGAEGQFSWTAGSEKYMVISNTMEEDGWQLIKLIPYTEINKAAQTNRNISIVIGLAFLAASVLLVTLISNAITRPLIRLSRKMNRFSEGYFDVEVGVKGTDEIAGISKQFNMMVMKTNELINERYKMKLVEKNAILKALEAEINPHFLYNALQAVSTMALKNGVQDIADMVDALAFTLRYCISGKEIVPLKDELKHIERYLVIQKARFGSRLQVVYDLDDGTSDIEIPKLSIQTLVENSVKHAVEKVSSPVEIIISVKLSSGHAVISVKDNGPGIPSKKMKQLTQSFRADWEVREDDSIGLKNLHDRLKLIFGEASGIEIHSDESGTEMRIIVPIGGRNEHV